jgi:hypothetical protein
VEDYLLRDNSPKFIEDFIKVWITGNVFGNVDQNQGSNMECIKKR